jgi:superfamily II DNA helicase RecQ
VAHNTLLEAIAAAKPKDLAELRRVKGMGDKKLAQYGNEILNTLDQEAGVKK